MVVAMTSLSSSTLIKILYHHFSWSIAPEEQMQGFLILIQSSIAKMEKAVDYYSKTLEKWKVEARAACPTMISPDHILRWIHVIVRRHVPVTRLLTSSDTRIASRFGCLDISLGPSGQQSTGLSNLNS